MAEDKNVVKQILWGEVFSFPHIFKSFQMAIQPGKLALAVLGLALIFGGGYVLDTVWCWAGATVPTQVNSRAPMVAHVGMDSEAYCDAVSDARDGRLDAAAALLKQIKDNERQLDTWKQQGGVFATEQFRERLADYNNRYKGDDPVSQSEIVAEAKKEDESYSDLLAQAEEALDKEFVKVEDLLDDYTFENKNEGEDELVDVLEKDMETRIEEAYKDENRDFTEDDADEMREQHEEAVEGIDQAFTARRLWFAQQKRDVVGTGVFETFVAYQANCVNNAMMSLWNLNFRGGLCGYNTTVQNRWFNAASVGEPATGLQDPGTITAPNERNGFVFYILMMAEGVRWMIVQHWLYATIFLLWTTAVCALIGGAIYRMTALHFAREEKISVGQALKFSKSKFFSFFCAPLVPIAVIVLTGLLIALGGFVFSLMGSVGAIIMGAIFFIPILLAIGIAFMAIGLAAGWPLMYPTIAVEGSDSFDAIGRSFSFVFSRPFRAVLYGAIAALYGMVTYLFVRFFAYVTLLAAHCFVKFGWWDLWDGGDALNNRADMIDVLWHKPTFWNLQTVNWPALGVGGWFAAVLIGIWVAIVAGAVLAYVWTFFASASTSIYFILRRRVDATDLDDVYVEEEAEPIAPVEEEATEEAAENNGDDEEQAPAEEDASEEEAEETADDDDEDEKSE